MNGSLILRMWAPILIPPAEPFLCCFSQVHLRMDRERPGLLTRCGNVMGDEYFCEYWCFSPEILYEDVDTSHSGFILFEDLLYLFEWITLREWESKTCLPSDVHYPKGCNQEVFPGFLHLCNGPGTWTFLFCFPMCIRRHPDQKWGSWDLNFTLFRMTAL